MGTMPVHRVRSINLSTAEANKTVVGGGHSGWGLAGEETNTINVSNHRRQQAINNSLLGPMVWGRQVVELIAVLLLPGISMAGQ